MTATLPPYARLCALAENVGAQAWRATTKSIITGEVWLKRKCPVRSVWSRGGPTDAASSFRRRPPLAGPG